MKLYHPKYQEERNSLGKRLSNNSIEKIIYDIKQLTYEETDGAYHKWINEKRNTSAGKVIENDRKVNTDREAKSKEAYVNWLKSKNNTSNNQLQQEKIEIKKKKDSSEEIKKSYLEWKRKKDDILYQEKIQKKEEELKLKTKREEKKRIAEIKFSEWIRNHKVISKPLAERNDIRSEEESKCQYQNGVPLWYLEALSDEQIVLNSKNFKKRESIQSIIKNANEPQHILKV